MSDEQRDKARSMLGDLASMSAQTDAMSRRILESSRERLAWIESSLKDAKVQALTGDDEAKRRYEDMIEDRGRLQNVIAAAREELP